MITKAKIDDYLTSLLDDYAIDNPEHRQFYRSQIQPRIYKEIMSALEVINFTSEQDCDRFFENFKKEHRNIFQSYLERINHSLYQFQKNPAMIEHKENLENQLNTYLRVVQAVAQNNAQSQLRSCAGSVSTVLNIFDEKIAQANWSSVDPKFKKQLDNYSKKFKEIHKKISQLQQKNIHEDPYLSQFKECYEQALDLMYRCREEINQEAERYQKQKNAPTQIQSFLQKVKTIISMLFKRLCSLFSKETTKKYKKEIKTTSNEVIIFGRAKTSSQHKDKNNNLLK